MLKRIIESVAQWLDLNDQTARDRMRELEELITKEWDNQRTRTITEQRRKESDQLIRGYTRELARLGLKLGNAEAIARAY